MGEHQQWEAMTMTSERSAAFAALRPSGKCVVKLLEAATTTVPDRTVLMSLATVQTLCGICRRSAQLAIKELKALGFVSVSHGARRVHVFTLLDDYRNLDETAARALLAGLHHRRAGHAGPKDVRRIAG